jgi:hypothetical protein
MTDISKTRANGERWPCWSWSQALRKAAARWESHEGSRATGLSRAGTHGSILLLLTAISLVSLARGAPIPSNAPREAPSPEPTGRSTCDDSDIAQLVREHRRAVRGL